MKQNIKISELNIYPVKSLAGLSLQSSDLDSMGLKYDRRWMLVTPDGLFLSQRKISQMALINTALDSGKLTLSMKGKEDHLVPEVNAASEMMSVRIWNDYLEVQKVGLETDVWLSNALGIDCHLVYIADEVIRQCDLDFSEEGNRTGFSDGFPILLISEASLDDLNNRLNDKAEKSVEMRRFRPNIVVSGCDAFAEDQWQNFQITGVEKSLAMCGVKLCSRCILTTVDPDKGERSGAEPLATLKSYRQVGNKVNFGMNVIHQQHGVLRVGDSVVI